ncbi:PREDICTED: tumor necrosis factor receptor superfamily member 6 [Tinamus guttatus]|uniref:tumor necrosis factor receptor superfamily member 6 n=1 Tax=Tinamus guttatus TaxID=94827 RepID=UPI00052EC7C2|nr:PREDICTED: tumor necrosis factor receptor superfamily member 6 [Tinamus guttatus]
MAKAKWKASPSLHLEGADEEALEPPPSVVGLIIESQCKNDTEASIHTAYNKIIVSRIIARREIKCTADEYKSGGTCCKKCERGFVKNTTCPKNIREHCVQCKPGQEYVDHANDLDECMRCDSCDSVLGNPQTYCKTCIFKLTDFKNSFLGLKTAKECTPTQNTECTCAENFFCNSSGSCTHCVTVALSKNNALQLQTLYAKYKILENVGVVLASCPEVFQSPNQEFLLYTRLLCNKTVFNEFVPCFSFQEMVPIMFADIDLSTYIPDIVGEMTLQEVKAFVRNRKVPEPMIDEIIRDNVNDTSEQKIKLFQEWHKRHGINGAYETLIRSLRKLKMCSAADKIERKLKAAIPSSQEVGQSYNSNIEQSTTCTQESGNSHLHNAELGKTCSDSSEET